MRCVGRRAERPAVEAHPPACAGSSPVSMLKVEVLPAPFGPITQ